MTAYRAPDFNERIALSRQTKQRALERLRAKPAPSEAELAEAKAARLKREEEQAAQRAQRAAEQKQARAEERRLAAEAAARAAEAANVPEKTEAQKKAERDARYAARKGRK